MSGLQNMHQDPVGVAACSDQLKRGKKVLVILRGLPGSGKSTLAARISSLNGNQGKIYSTDDFFIEDGEYIYDGTQIGKAHDWNKERTAKALKAGEKLVIIDNTNKEAFEMEPYIEMGVKYAYLMHLIEPNTSWNYNVKKLARKNSHAIKGKKLRRMLERYDTGISLKLLASNLSLKLPKDDYSKKSGLGKRKSGDDVEEGRKKTMKYGD